MSFKFANCDFEDMGRKMIMDIILKKNEAEINENVCYIQNYYQ